MQAIISRSQFELPEPRRVTIGEERLYAHYLGRFQSTFACTIAIPMAGHWK